MSQAPKDYRRLLVERSGVQERYRDADKNTGTVAPKWDSNC